MYGALPTEHYQTVELALKRITQLLPEASASAIGGVALRELRELHGLSQTELGAKPGIKQAAVSRVERRSDLHLDVLIAIVQALGGTLEIRVRFLNCADAVCWLGSITSASFVKLTSIDLLL